MTLFTLPKWAAIVVAILIWPSLSLAMSVWFFAEGGNNYLCFASGVFACCFIRDAFKIKERFFGSKK